MKRIRWPVFLLVLTLLFMPSMALADDTSYENDVSNNKVMLLEASPTPLQKIQQVWNTPLFLFGANRYWYTPNALFRMLVLGSENNAISPIALAVVFVFLWWGVRKCIRMIFRSFRKGKING